MWHTKRHLTISKRILILLSFLYLLLQTGLFLQGWFSPLIANGLILAVLGILLAYLLRFNKQDANDLWILNRKDILLTLMALSVLLCFLVMGGLLGYFFRPHDDLICFRQALYSNLIHAPWPLVLPDGREMSYYLAAMLPPAMLARILPENWQQVPILLNTFIPLSLVLLLFWQRWKKVSLFFLLIILAFSEPSRFFFPQPGTPFETTLCGIVWKILNIKDSISVLHYFNGNYTLLPPAMECIGAFNSNPSTLLVAALLPQLKQSRGLIPLAVALLLPISPLGAIACMPLALWFFLSGRKIPFVSCVIPSLLAVTVAFYFLRIDSDINVVAPAWTVRGMRFWAFYLRYLAGIALLIAPLWPFRKRDGLYLVTSLSAILLPLLYIGTLPEICHPNELMLKGGIAYSLLLGSMWCEDWYLLRPIIRRCMVAWLIIVLLTYTYRTTCRFSWEQRRVNDIWNGHLCHNRLFLKQSIPDVKEPLIPGVILRKSGESEEHFPGSILPKADGKVPYGTPPSPHAFP